MKAHLMGICGSGMSGLAAWMSDRGYTVSGCDRDPSGEGWLRELGIPVYEGHSADHAEPGSVFVYTAAVPADSPELAAARASGARVLRRSEALAEMCERHRTVAISGAHGKTTSTAMSGWILQETGSDPTVLAGGKVRGWSGGYRRGGEIAIVEADEYDRAFLRIPHAHSAVTSFDVEHLECYGTEELLRAAFQTFLELTAPGGGVVVPVEDTDLSIWAKRLGRKILTAGPGGDFDCTPTGPDGWGEGFEVCGVGFRLGVPGLANLRNASTGLAVESLLGISPVEAAATLDSFPGVERRLERLGRRGGKLIVSDYAHHPREIAASIQAVRRAEPLLKIAVIFEPHLFSRTARFAVEMGEALALADFSAVLPIYPAREQPLPGITNGLVVEAALRAGAVSTLCEPSESVSFTDSVPAGVVVYMGAGTSDHLARLALGGPG